MRRYGAGYDRHAWGGSYYGRPIPTWGDTFRPRYGAQGGYGAEPRAGGYRYDRGFSRGGWGSGYDGMYKSQRQTNYGDPFGDRVRRTPMWVTRGAYEGPERDSAGRWGHDRADYGEYGGGGRYDRDWAW